MPPKAFVFDAYGTLYDVQSVATAAGAAFPGYGALVTQVWRLKQLEYTWLRSLLGEWKAFASVTEESLRYALRALGLDAEAPVVRVLCEGYERLDPYPDALPTLRALAGRPRAILSNGGQAMLDALVANTGLDRHLDAVLSVDAAGIYKPAPAAYEVATRHLSVEPAEVVFVSSNPFDVAGAKRFGFKVAFVARTAPAELGAEAAGGATLSPLAFFRVLRTQLDELGHAPDWTVTSLAELPGVAGLSGAAGARAL